MQPLAHTVSPLGGTWETMHQHPQSTFASTSWESYSVPCGLRQRAARTLVTCTKFPFEGARAATRPNQRGATIELARGWLGLRGEETVVV